MKILNIAGGKFRPLSLDGDILANPTYEVNVDTGHYSELTPSTVEERISVWEMDPNRFDKTAYCNADVFEFMERTTIRFDRAVIYRFLEHVSFTQVLYFIYLVSTVTVKDAFVDVIVPNYEILARRILNETSFFGQGNSTVSHFKEYQGFENWNVELTTEILNEPSCPHASIWTPMRASLFWELEKRFKVLNVEPNFRFDGRSIYMRFVAQRM